MSKPIKLQRLFLSETSFLLSCLSLSLSLSLSRSFLLFLKFNKLYKHWPTSEEREQIVEELYSSDGGIGDDEDGDDGDDSERPKKVQIDWKPISWNQSIQQQEKQKQIHTNHPHYSFQQQVKDCCWESRKRPTTITITTIITTIDDDDDNNKKRVSRPKLRKSHQMCTNPGSSRTKKTLDKKKTLEI